MAKTIERSRREECLPGRVRARGLVVKCAVRFTTSRQTEKYRIGREYRYCLFTGTVGTGVRYCTATVPVPVLYRNSTVPVVPVQRVLSPLTGTKPHDQAVHRRAG